MNTLLPIGIESYLKEAGFSATEMIIIKKLVEEDAFTLRELASKTGKSTGVLDQAMKKLLGKKIVEKKLVNDHPKYSIHSLDAIVKWVQRDMRERKDTLDRRHENFEQFIASLKIDKKRPDMEYFQGLSGIEQAYSILLESGAELLTIMPVTTTAEDDPLRDFKVTYFRKRQYRKIFQRVLAPDAPLARRFQSRDAFEYRKTLLMPAEECSLKFEMTIAGDIVACIDMENESACFIRFPGLAEAEKASFEMQWARQQMRERGDVHAEPVLATYMTVIPLKTRLLSNFREFMLSRKSIAAFILFALISGAMTFGLYKANRELNLERMKDKVVAIAATGALQFDAKDIDAIWRPEDINKPEYAKLVATLNLIRRSNEDIQYAYLMRKNVDPTKLEFVADADSLYPNQQKDLNKDGIVNDADSPNTPGELYEDDEFPLIREALEAPFAGIGSDQWGTFITGHAPIRDKSGNGIAVLGVDIFSSKLDELSAETFTPLFAFFALFLLFVIVRFGALNRSLLSECACSLRPKIRLVLLWVIFGGLCLVSLVYAFQLYTFHLKVQQTGEKLMAIAVTAANDFDPADLEQLHWARDMKTEAYQRVFKRLNDLREKNIDITFAYIVRQTELPDLFEFVADSDSNYNLPDYMKFNINDLAPMDESDENIWPGFIYDDSLGYLYKKSLNKANFGVTPYDQWGSFISACAPINLKRQKTVSLLCLDIELDAIANGL